MAVALPWVPALADGENLLGWFRRISTGLNIGANVLYRTVDLDLSRAPSASEYKKTLVLSIPLVEASAKIRGGDPIDDDADMEGPHWAGIVPLKIAWGEPVAASDLFGQPKVPGGLSGLAGKRISPP